MLASPTYIDLADSSLLRSSLLGLGAVLRLSLLAL